MTLSHPKNPHLPNWVEEGMLIRYIGKGSPYVSCIKHGAIFRVSWNHTWRNHPRVFVTEGYGSDNGYKANGAGGPDCWKKLGEKRKRFKGWIRSIESNAE